MAALGTWAWAIETGGRLAWHDRLRLLAQAVAARAAARRARGADRGVRVVDVESIVPPDSAITRAAVALAEGMSPPWLFNHCMRAYFWARLLDEDRRPYDDEAVFTALLLHDLGLTPAGRARAAGEGCFTLFGARQAESLALRHGWGERRARLVAEAITLHLNVTVGQRHGKEAQMVRTGSGGDVAGLGLAALGAGPIQQVVARYPRQAFKAQISAALDAEARDYPCCRAGFLCRRLRFTELIARTRAFGD